MSQSNLLHQPHKSKNDLTSNYGYSNVDIIQIILNCSGLSDTQRWLLIYSARRANTLSFRTRLSQEGAAEFVGVHPNTICNNINRMRQVGLFKKVRVRGRARATTYLVDLTSLLPKGGE